MKLFVGLGNPGDRYARNRHNVGFMAVERIAREHGFGSWRKKFQGLVSEGTIGSEKVLLLKPQTYMNESGRSVGEASRFLKLPAEVPVIVVEGNYLLLRLPPWDRLKPMFDVTAMVDVPEHVLRSRLRGRWERLGLTEDEIVAKLEENDLPNGRMVRDASVLPDYWLENG